MILRRLLITVTVSVAVILGSKGGEKMETDGNKKIQQVEGTQLRRDLAHSWSCWSKANTRKFLRG